MKIQGSEIRGRKKQKCLSWSGVWIRNLLSCLLYSVFCLLFFTGCKQEGAPPPPVAVVKKETPKPEPASIAGEAKNEEKASPQTDKLKSQRNPFKTFIVKSTDRPTVVTPKTPLQRYELDNLKLVAVMWGMNSPIAMVEAPDGKGYKIKKGDLVGSRDGRVKRIEKDRVIVEERFTEANGEVVTNEFEIRLPLPKEEEETR